MSRTYTAQYLNRKTGRKQEFQLYAKDMAHAILTFNELCDDGRLVKILEDPEWT